MNEMLFDSSGFELPQNLKGLTSKAKITLFKALVKDPTDTQTYPVYDDNISQNGRHVYHSKDNKQTFEVYQDDTGHTYVKRYNNDGEIIKASGDWKIIDKGKAEGKTATPATEQNFTNEGKLSPPTLNPSLDGSLSTYNYADREVVVANDNGSAIAKEYIIDVNKFHSKLSAENLRDGKGLVVGYDLGKGSYKLTYLEEPTVGIHPDNPDRVTFSQVEYGVEASAGLGGKIEIQKPADVLKFSEKVKLTAGVSGAPSLDWTIGNSEYIQSLPEADRLQLQNEAIKYELSGQSATDLEQTLQLSDPDFPLTTISRDYNIPQLTDDQRTMLEQRLLDNQERLVNEYGINTSEVANQETSTDYETPVANTDVVPQPQVESNGQQSLSTEEIYKGFPENYSTPTDDTVSDTGSEDNTDDFASPSASLSDTGGKDDIDDFASPSASVSDAGGEDDTDDFASPSASVSDAGGEDDTDDFTLPSASVSDPGGEDDTDDFALPSASVSDTGGEDDTDDFALPSASVADTGGGDNTDNFALPSASVRDPGGEDDTDDVELPSATVSDTGGEDDTDDFASPSASVSDAGGEDDTDDFALPSAATFENSAVAEYPVASGNENKSSVAERESNNNSTQGTSVYPGSLYANANKLSPFNTGQQPLPSFNDQMSSLSSISDFISEQEGDSAPNNSDSIEPNFSATNAATPETLNTEVVPDTYNNLSSPAEYDGTGAESTNDGTGSETTYDGTGAESTYDGTGAETTYDGTGAESTYDGIGSETTYTEPETADIGEPDSSDTLGSDSSDYGSSDSASSDSGGYDSSASSSDSGGYDSSSGSSDSDSYDSSDSDSYDSSASSSDSGSSDSDSYDSAASSSDSGSSDSDSYDSSASSSDSGSYDSSSSSYDSSGSSDSGSSDSGGGGDSGSGSGGDSAGSAI